MEVKPLLKEDLEIFIPQFKKWLKELFPEYTEKTREFFSTTEAARDELLKRIEDGQEVLVAWVQGDPVGVLIGLKPMGGVAMAEWLMVDADHQKKGIASTLLNEWEKSSLKQGVHNLRLEVIERNLNFYKNRGFELVGLDKNGYFGTDNYIMKKLISDPKEENFLK